MFSRIFETAATHIRVSYLYYNIISNTCNGSLLEKRYLFAGIKLLQFQILQMFQCTFVFYGSNYLMTNPLLRQLNQRTYEKQNPQSNYFLPNL